MGPERLKVKCFGWVLNPDETLPMLGMLFAIRLIATSTVIASGGVGGVVFIPLAVLGLIIGRIVGGRDRRWRGIDGFLPLHWCGRAFGGWISHPLAAVMFVAESTGAHHLWCWSHRCCCKPSSCWQFVCVVEYQRRYPSGAS